MLSLETHVDKQYILVRFGFWILAAELQVVQAGLKSAASF